MSNSKWIMFVLFLLSACSADPGTSETDGPVGSRGDSGNSTLDIGIDADSETSDPDVGIESDSDSATDTTLDTNETDTEITPPEVPISRDGLLASDPDSVYLSYFDGEPRIDTPVTLTNRGEGNVHITEIVLEEAASSFNIFDNRVNLDLAPMESSTFTVRFESNGETYHEGMVRVYMTNDDPLEIPLLATRKGTLPEEPRCIEVSTANVNFGSIVRGVDPDGEQTFEIRNCGNNEVTVSRLDRGSVFFTPTPANFQWDPVAGPIVIPTGGSETVTVTFTPGRVGRVSGKIDIRTNVEGNETLSVNLNANVERPPIGDLDLHLILNWDESPGADVDFHFMPEGAEYDGSEDCYYGNMEPDWGVSGVYEDNPFLDVDDLEGPGPENINVDELADGRYLISVYYYSDTGSGSSDGMSKSTNAEVYVYIHGTLAQHFGPHHLGSSSDRWDVAIIDWPSGTLTAP